MKILDVANERGAAKRGDAARAGKWLENEIDEAVDHLWVRDAPAATERLRETEARFQTSIGPERTHRQTLEAKLADVEAALEQAERRRVSEAAASAEYLARREAEFNALMQQLSEAVATLEEARNDRASETVAAALAEAVSARITLEGRLADAEATVRHLEHRSSGEQVAAELQAAQRQAELEAQLTQGAAGRQALERKLAEAEAALQDTEQRYESERKRAAAHLVEHRAQHDAGLAQAAEARVVLEQDLAAAKAVIETRLTQEVITRQTLERRLAEAEAARQDTGQRYASERETAAAHLAERDVQHHAMLAEAAAARDTLARQLSETAAALEEARNDRASEAVAAVSTRNTLEGRLADAEATVRHAEQQAAQRQAEFEAQLTQGAAGRQTLERKLAEAEAARQDTEQGYESERKRSAAQLVEHRAQHDAGLAQAAEARIALEQDLAAAKAALQAEQRAVLESRLAAQQAAQHQAAIETRLTHTEQRYASERETAAAHLAEREVRHHARLAEVAAARDTLARQLSEAAASLEQARRDGALEAAAAEQRAAQRQAEFETQLAREAAAAERLTRREAELGAALGEAVETRNALDSRLADAEAALRHGEQRASAERRAAAQRQAELEAQLTQELATRQALEHDLSETRLAGEQARRRLLDEADAIRERTRGHEARLEERIARERADHERALAEMQDRIGQLQQERENLQQSLGAAQEQLQRLNTTHNQERERHERERLTSEAEYRRVSATLERISKEHATERARLETLVTEREAQLKEQSATHSASQRAAREAFTQIEGELKTLRQELADVSRQREALRTEADRVPQLQNRLEESQKENRRQFESTPYGVCRFGLDGAITHVNDALVRLLGYRTADELRKVDFATTVFESADGLGWLIERCIESGKTESEETTWRRKKSGRLIVRLLAFATSPDSVEIVAEDITHLRALEAKLRRSQRMESVGRLASEVAVTCDHLLRDVGQNGQQWLATIDNDTVLRHRGERLLSEVTRAASFLRQLTVYGKKQTDALEPVNVLRVLRDLEPVIKLVAGDDTELDLPKSASQVDVDVDVEAERVERVLVNVASYARERMPSGGRLKVELSTVVVDRKFVAQHPNVRPGGHVVITATEVRGTGQPDWPIGTRPAFDKPGVDLGALQALVNNCGGHLWVMAEPAGNLVLKLHLPKRAPDLTELQTPVTRSNQGGLMARWLGN